GDLREQLLKFATENKSVNVHVEQEPIFNGQKLLTQRLDIVMRPYYTGANEVPVIITVDGVEVAGGSLLAANSPLLEALRKGYLFIIDATMKLRQLDESSVELKAILEQAAGI